MDIFLESTICVAKLVNILDAITKDVIDGQQRMTFVSILLAVLYSKIASYKEKLDDDGKTDLNNIKRELA